MMNGTISSAYYMLMKLFLKPNAQHIQNVNHYAVDLAFL